MTAEINLSSIDRFLQIRNSTRLSTNLNPWIDNFPQSNDKLPAFSISKLSKYIIIIDPLWMEWKKRPTKKWAKKINIYMLYSCTFRATYKFRRNTILLSGTPSFAHTHTHLCLNANMALSHLLILVMFWETKSE